MTLTLSTQSLDNSYCEFIHLSINSQLMRSFGEQLKAWRDRLGWNQAELARRLGISATHVSNLERDYSPSAESGRPQPSRELCDEIARVLNIPRGEVYFAAGYLPPEPTPEQLQMINDLRMAEDYRLARIVAAWPHLSGNKRELVMSLAEFLLTYKGEPGDMEMRPAERRKPSRTKEAKSAEMHPTDEQIEAILAEYARQLEEDREKVMASSGGRMSEQGWQKFKQNRIEDRRRELLAERGKKE